MKLTKKRTGFLIAVLVLAAAVYAVIPSSISLPEPGPETLLFNGKILTVDKNNPSAEAVILLKGKILFAGSLKEAETRVSANADRIDLKGRTLIPGFNDNHTHTFAAGIFYESPVLWGKSCEEIGDIIKLEASRKKPGELITGNSWDYTTCPKPHKSMLDKAAPHNPVMLIQFSAHAAWVNSRQLEEMDINGNTPDPKGGQIVRDEKGKPTGILRDTAMGTSGYSQYTSNLLIGKNHRRVIDVMLEKYREAGITSVQDNTWEPLTGRLLAEYRNDGSLTCRFTCWPIGEPSMAQVLMKAVSYDDEWIRPGLLKYFADGAFSTRTAWLLDKAYADEPGNFGSPRYSDAEMNEIVLKAARDKKQLTFHAIGDAAVRQFLNAVEKAQSLYPWTKELRFRMEHVQIVAPEDIERIGKLGVVACVQPFAMCDPVKDNKLLGYKRAQRAYPFHSLFKKGVPLAFGSDAPAEVDFTPLLGIYYAVTRKSKDGKHGPLNAGERFSPYEALYCYTMGSAYAEFMENKKGSITAGKVADLVILSDDLTAVKPEKIKDIEILMTISGGRIVYRNKRFPK
ncbi:MAG: hypothetical protein CVV44_09495 [Spirochaetae bacterium HGW-Spirochaetae-1]|nr:MAG: hypothetical protein CVV44_09495 [Spirochaetae bacterium HGW-Spirochaetae-1]